MSDKKLYLLDAYALIFRAYYALIRNPRVTSTGRNTNAQFGFTNTLLELLNKKKPTHLAVCFDTAEPTERHVEFDAYKANRQETPEDLSAAVPDIRKIIEALNIPILEKHGYEADDVIGTLAWQASDLGYEVYMVTPDKDYGQLVRDNVFIYKPGYQGGDVEILGPKEVCEKWDIEAVDQVVDILGLMGDAVDNIPGIKGVGEKTAAKLLKEYKTLESILENADSIKGSLGEKVRNGRESAVLSKRLARIITNVPVEFHEEDFKVKEVNKDALIQIFTDLEFKTMAQRVLGVTVNVPVKNKAVQQDLFGEPVATAQDEEQVTVGEITEAAPLKTISDVQHQYHLVDNAEAIDNLLALLHKHNSICFDTETDNIDANLATLVGMSFAVTPHEAYYVPIPEDADAANEILQKFSSLFANPQVRWIGQNLKYDLLILKWNNIQVAGTIHDTMLAHYVIEPEGRRNMDLLSEQYLRYKPISITELIGKKGKTQSTMRQVPVEEAKDYAAEDADITLQLHNTFMPMVQANKVEKVLEQVENPLVKVLTNMEFEGIRIDEEFLNDYSKELERDARNAEETVYRLAGVRFNLASPKQLGEVLFEKLKLDPNAKKTKTGQYQTGEDVLLKLAAKGYEIVDSILTFRELTKLKSTYVDALPQLINPKTGRVHTSYAQAVAVTGRLSSNNPNLQNIPVRTDRGKEIRKAFIPRTTDHVLLSVDYSQIELRIVAAISGDENMCEAFRSGKDIHQATAAKVYGVAMEDVTKEMRYKAKSVNFGIIYGQGAFGLAENLGISRTEAKEIIDNYKREFPGIQQYMNNMITFAQEKGYVETLMGRKRWLSDINSKNFTVRGFAERNAINSPIQGTAADMIKLAMIKIHNELAQHNFNSRMILQVHDELLFDVHKPELDTIKEIVVRNMETAFLLPNGVPVVAEAGTGNNWLQAH
ncbi:DNA polymerase I [Polluticaenibacter yanchengensis]|uniref:DNA polymerase I n=1 Tax=Polluticaenibacter yanchengensis TaxID=3014562 RepID=A0ABT4UPA2_9BACT|nr:DNA polymerase I [Chitinophagaceae bacterium LY-5]